jgi:hypothetical protein
VAVWGTDIRRGFNRYIAAASFLSLAIAHHHGQSPGVMEDNILLWQNRLVAIVSFILNSPFYIPTILLFIVRYPVLIFIRALVICCYAMVVALKFEPNRRRFFDSKTRIVTEQLGLLTGVLSPDNSRTPCISSTDSSTILLC